MNLEGHSQYYWNREIPEIRLTGAIPLWLDFEGVSVLPAIPFKPALFLDLPSQTKVKRLLYRRLNKAYDKLFRKPYESGFGFYYKKQREVFFISGLSSVESNLNNKNVILQGTGQLYKSIAKGLPSFIESFVDAKNLRISKVQSVCNKKILMRSNLIKVCEEIKNPESFSKVCFSIRTHVDTTIIGRDSGIYFKMPNNIIMGVHVGELKKLTRAQSVSSTGGLTLWTLEIENSNDTSKFEAIIAFGRTKEDIIRTIQHEIKKPN